MYGNTSDGSMEFIKTCFILIVICVIMFTIFSFIHDVLIGEITFADLPFTKHAEELERNWNAVKVKEYMDSGRCIPNSCIVGDTIIYFCEYDMQPKYSLILIVGKTVEQVITGRMMDTDRIGKLCTK